MDLNELLTQVALGTLPEKYKLAICDEGTLDVAKGNRKCTLCDDQIKKGEQCYKLTFGGFRSTTAINICMDCSYVSIVKASKI